MIFFSLKKKNPQQTHALTLRSILLSVNAALCELHKMQLGLECSFVLIIVNPLELVFNVEQIECLLYNDQLSENSIHFASVNLINVVQSLL